MTADDNYPDGDTIHRGIAETAASAGNCEWTSRERRERERVMAAGFTGEEAICWLLINRTAATYMMLPALHPDEKAEATLVFHAIQEKLILRPTYRRYRESVRDEMTEP